MRTKKRLCGWAMYPKYFLCYYSKWIYDSHHPFLLNDSPICSCVQSIAKQNSGWISKILSKGSYKANSLRVLYKLTRGLLNKAYLINCSAYLIYSCHLIWARQDIYSPGCTNLKKKLENEYIHNHKPSIRTQVSRLWPNGGILLPLFLHVRLHFC